MSDKKPLILYDGSFEELNSSDNLFVPSGKISTALGEIELDKLSNKWIPSVLNIQSAPPAGPNVGGDRYGIENGTDAWVGKDGAIAIWNSGTPGWDYDPSSGSLLSNTYLYNEIDNHDYVWNGDEFVDVGGGVQEIGDLNDVDTSGVSHGQVLAFDDGDDTWKPISVSGDTVKTSDTDSTAGYLCDKINSSICVSSEKISVNCQCFHLKNNFVSVSAGIGDANKPIKLNASGILDTQMLGPYDHGDLNGLSNDDHTQYLNQTRGDLRYYRQTEFVTTSTPDKAILLNGSGKIPSNMIDASQIDHNSLSNLNVLDPHTQYHNDTRAYTKTNMQTSGESVVAWGNINKIGSKLSHIEDVNTAGIQDNYVLIYCELNCWYPVSYGIFECKGHPVQSTGLIDDDTWEFLPHVEGVAHPSAISGYWLDNYYGETGTPIVVDYKCYRWCWDFGTGSAVWFNADDGQIIYIKSSKSYAVGCSACWTHGGWLPTELPSNGICATSWSQSAIVDAQTDTISGEIWGGCIGLYAHAEECIGLRACAECELAAEFIAPTNVVTICAVQSEVPNERCHALYVEGLDRVATICATVPTLNALCVKGSTELNGRNFKFIDDNTGASFFHCGTSPFVEIGLNVDYSGQAFATCGLVACSSNDGYDFYAGGTGKVYLNCIVGLTSFSSSILCAPTCIDSCYGKMKCICTNCFNMDALNFITEPFVVASSTDGVCSIIARASGSGSNAIVGEGPTDGYDFCAGGSGKIYATQIDGISFTTTLAALTDTNMTGIYAGSLLVYNGSSWVTTANGQDIVVCSASKISSTSGTASYRFQTDSGTTGMFGSQSGTALSVSGGTLGLSVSGNQAISATGDSPLSAVYVSNQYSGGCGLVAYSTNGYDMYAAGTGKIFGRCFESINTSADNLKAIAAKTTNGCAIVGCDTGTGYDFYAAGSGKIYATSVEGLAGLVESLNDLSDVDDSGSPVDGSLLVYDSATLKWYASNTISQDICLTNIIEGTNWCFGSTGWPNGYYVGCIASGSQGGININAASSSYQGLYVCNSAGPGVFVCAQGDNIAIEAKATSGMNSYGVVACGWDAGVYTNPGADFFANGTGKYRGKRIMLCGPSAPTSTYECAVYACAYAKTIYGEATNTCAIVGCAPSKAIYAHASNYAIIGCVTGNCAIIGYSDNSYGVLGCADNQAVSGDTTGTAGSCAVTGWGPADGYDFYAAGAGGRIRAKKFVANTSEGIDCVQLDVGNNVCLVICGGIIVDVLI